MGRYSTPITGLISRLEFHAGTGAGKICTGLKVITIPVIDVEGKVDLPSVRLFVPDLDERFAPAKNLDGTIKIKMLIATDRDKGLPELMSWVEKILDAIQTDTAGQNTALPGTARHFDCKAEDNYPKDNSLNAMFLITLYPPKHLVGHRRG